MPTYSPLLTDQYQLVMAYSYWKLGFAEREAVFQLSFRKLAMKSPFIVAAGLNQVIDFLENFQFTESDIDYLRGLQNGHGPLFPEEFLTYLKQLRFSCSIDAVVEGTVVHAKEPVLRIRGPILQCQLLETPLINFINFASLIATKASQVYLAAGGDPIIEFGLRRAQGPDGALTASRSAYIGGCSATSNALAGKLYDIPIHGTQAHSWIMAFATELAAFENFASVMKDRTVLLVDTYDTLKGVHHAIQIGNKLKENGNRLVAVRLDSGNLLELSRKTRYLLDKADLRETKIIASGDLDENIIRNLKASDAPIDSWGVGTRLVTSYDQPALNTIYKLTALKDETGAWDYKMKLSDSPQKSTLPGILQIKRLFKKQIPIGDIIYDIELGEEIFSTPDTEDAINLLHSIYQDGKLIYEAPTLQKIRDHALSQIELFAKKAPKPYSVSIGPRLQTTIEALTEKIRQINF